MDGLNLDTIIENFVERAWGLVMRLSKYRANSKSFFLVSLSVLVHASLCLCAAQAQVEYVKVCDNYGAGYYYIPGTDTCLKIGGYVKFESLPAGTQAPQPPAGCAACRELNAEIEKLTDRYVKLEGKGVPKWREDIASDLANLQKQKAECQKVCSPAAQTTRENVKVCDAYGANSYYIPGTETCLKLSSNQRYDWKEVPRNANAPPPPAGCTTCGALDTEIKSLEADYKALDGKSGDAIIAQRKELDAQITKLQGLKSGCQRVCSAPPRTSKKKNQPGQYYKKDAPPLRTLTPPGRTKQPPGMPDRERNQSG